jgi:hypothetical protein
VGALEVKLDPKQWAEVEAAIVGPAAAATPSAPRKRAAVPVRRGGRPR